MKKKSLLFIAAILVILVFAVGCGGAKQGGDTSGAPAMKFVRIGTAQLGGGTYNHGLGMSTVVNSELKGYKLEALPTSGAVESARMLENKEVEIACLGVDIVFDQYNGLGRYEGKAWKEARLLFPQFGTYVNIVVPVKSPIKSFADMKGKKVGVGNPGSAGYYLITHILRSQGLNEGDYVENPLSPTEQTTALRDGHLDVFGYYTTPNSPPVVELSTTMNVRWLDVDKAKWDAYAKANKLPFTIVNVPAGTYKGMDKDTATVSGMNVYATTAEMSEEMAYEITKAFFTRFDDAVKIVPAIAEIKTLLPVITPVVQWHPGAVKYFKEAGMKYNEYAQ